MSDAALSRASDLGAFCRHDPISLPGAGSGPLESLAFAVKDVFAIAGARACYGNPTWLRTHSAAHRTASAIEKLRAAGASLLGATITDELALSLTGENAHFGTPQNPRCPGRVPGGSSSGSAVAVASEQVDFALGTDTGGSVRVPASHTGLFGFRPSHGAVESDGVLPLAPRFDTVGWFTREPALLQQVGQVLLPPPSEPVEARSLVFWPALLSLVDEQARAPFADAATKLAHALALPLRPAALPTGLPPLGSWLSIYLTLQNLEARALHGAFIERERPIFGSLVGARFARVMTTDAALAVEAERSLAAFRRALADVFDDGAWVILPSAPGAAPLVSQPDSAIDAYTARALTLAAPASLAGLPQVTLPLAECESCPFGVSFLAPLCADHALLGATVRASRALLASEKAS